MTNKPQIEPKIAIAGIVLLAVAGMYFAGVQLPFATVSEGIVTASANTYQVGTDSFSGAAICNVDISGGARVLYSGTYYVKACWVESGSYKCATSVDEIYKKTVLAGDSPNFIFSYRYEYRSPQSIEADITLFKSGSMVGTQQVVTIGPCGTSAPSPTPAPTPTPPVPTPIITPAPIPTPPPCTDSPICVWDSQGLYKIEQCGSFIKWCNWGDTCASGTCIPPAPSPTPTAPSPTPTLPPEPTPTNGDDNGEDDEDEKPDGWWYSYAAVGGGIVIVALLLFRRPRMPVRAPAPLQRY